MPDTYVRRIPEIVVPGRRLGRHVRHDPRSLRYLYPARAGAAVTSVRHARAIPVLDQGELGSCTGNACEGAVGTAPLYAAVPASVRARPTGDADADEKQAVALYSAATQLDDYDGGYPPVDTGSDGLSVAKAAVKAGLISGYTHCTSLDAVLAALQAQPVITGVNWYDSFDEPNESGLIALPKQAQVRGGHEFVLDEVVADQQLIGATNSWGTSFGVAGRFYIPFAIFERLLGEDGDGTVLTPLSLPAPTPTPDDPGDELAGCLPGFISAAQRWLDQRKG